MPLLGLRNVGERLDRLLRPDRAARNAREAASEAHHAVRERETVERDVDAITDRPADS